MMAIGLYSTEFDKKNLRHEDYVYNYICNLTIGTYEATIFHV